MTEKNEIVGEVLKGIENFKKESIKVLSRLENSKTRIITIEETYKQLKGLDVKQEDMIRESLRCIENELFRAAHILAWSGFIDYLGTLLVDLEPASMDSENLREQFSDFKIIEQAVKLGIVKKLMGRSLKALLTKRNECAHPSDFFPGLNETLGYVSEIIARIRMIQKP